MKKVIFAIVLLAAVIAGVVVWNGHTRQQKIDRYMDIFGGEQYEGVDAHSPSGTGSAQVIFNYTYTFDDDGSCKLDVSYRTRKQTGYTDRQFTDLKWTVEASGNKMYLRVTGFGGKDAWKDMTAARISGKMEICDYTENEKEIFLKVVRNDHYDLTLWKADK